MLHPIDLIIIFVYLIAMIGIGIACKGKQQNASDYFTASGKMGGTFQSILVGLSIAATLFSGISFLGYPSVVYTHGVAILLGLLAFPVFWLILKFWFLPKYLKEDNKQPYDIIEKRLGPGMRTLAASMYICLRIGWMAALIYAPTIALMAAGGLSEYWFWPIVLTIGISSTIYTTLGGIRGVVVTDAIQFMVIAIGILLTISIISYKLPVPVSEMMSHLQQTKKFKVIDFSLDPTKMFTVWSIFLGFFIANASAYMGDQMSLQRYLATGNVKSASRSFLSNVIGVIIVLTLLAAVGLSLAGWYHFTPDSNLPAEADKIFPHFVSTQLPIGIAGLLLAAILAATMSSMTSGINTLAASITLDFRVRLGSELSPQKQLKFAKISCLVIGLVSSLVAGIVGRIGTIFDITMAMLGLFSGPLLAYILLSLFTRPVNKVILLISTILALLAGAYVTFSPCANIWVAAVSFVITIAPAFVVSLIPGKNHRMK